MGRRALAEHVLDDQDRLGEADVGELGRGHEVADGVHTRLVGATELIDHHETPLVDLDGGVARGPAGPSRAVARH